MIAVFAYSSHFLVCLMEDKLVLTLLNHGCADCLFCSVAALFTYRAFMFP